MLVRINKDNMISFESIGIKDAMTINAWIKNKFETMIEQDSDLSVNYSLLTIIRDNTDFIVDSIKSKSEKKVITSSVQVNETINKKPLSEKQASYYNDKYNGYKKNFEQTNSRGTDSKLIKDLYVFEPGKNEINHQLHIDLGMLVLEKDVDRTEYMNEEFYNYLR